MLDQERHDRRAELHQNLRRRMLGNHHEGRAETSLADPIVSETVEEHTGGGLIPDARKHIRSSSSDAPRNSLDHLLDTRRSGNGAPNEAPRQTLGRQRLQVLLSGANDADAAVQPDNDGPLESRFRVEL